MTGSGGAVVVAALGAAAVLLALWRPNVPGARAGASRAPRAPWDEREARAGQEEDSAVGRMSMAIRRLLRHRDRRADIGLELGLVCTQVASRLRAGTSPQQAWEQELSRADGLVADGPDASDASVARLVRDGVPPRLAALAGGSVAVDAAIAACRVAARSGAPLADVLESCAGAVAEAEAAEHERARARAGPAATALVLGWLPLATLLVGVVIGADPVAVALSGGAGSAAIVGGIVLLVVGRRWSAHLVRRAARESPSERRPPSERRSRLERRWWRGTGAAGASRSDAGRP